MQKKKNKKIECLSVAKNTVKEKKQAVNELRQNHRLAILLAVSRFSRSTYCHHVKQSSKLDKCKTVKEEILAITKSHTDIAKLLKEASANIYARMTKDKTKLLREGL